jgi:putative oxidoreductase
MKNHFNITRFVVIDFFSRSFTDYGTAFLRLAVGVMMFVHGLDKFIHYHDKAPEFLDPFGVGGEVSLALAIFAEGICSLLVMIGFFLRLALLPLITTMLVAFFVAHSGDPYDIKETALLYLIVYISLLVVGPGRLSFDHLISNQFVSGSTKN